MLIFLGAFTMVFLAEMGDKSQLLAMTLATRYTIKQVLLGVILATFFNNGIAVLLGYYMRYTLDMQAVQVAAAISFIGFGVWRLLEKDEAIENNPGDSTGKSKEELSCTLSDNTKDNSSYRQTTVRRKWWKSLLTVTVLLFISEIGDKTQLATVAYVVQYNAPWKTLLGVIAGMATADALGIFAGAYLSRLLTPKTIKYASSGIFILIGILSLYFLLLD